MWHTPLRFEVGTTYLNTQLSRYLMHGIHCTDNFAAGLCMCSLLLKCIENLETYIWNLYETQIWNLLLEYIIAWQHWSNAMTVTITGFGSMNKFLKSHNWKRDNDHKLINIDCLPGTLKIVILYGIISLLTNVRPPQILNKVQNCIMIRSY